MSGWSRELRRRVEDGFYEFLSACYINSKDKGRICLGSNLYYGQKLFFKTVFDALENDIHDIYCLKSRQLGISTSSRALEVFFNGLYSGVKGALVFDTDQNKQEARADIITMINDLPRSLKFPRVVSDNRHALTLENSSKILFLSAGTSKRKSSGTLGRSVGLSFSHGSELCSWDNDEGLEAYRNSLSDENPDRLYIWESTARGYNIWNELWTDARKDPTHCACVFLGWWSKDSQRIERDSADFIRYGEQAPTEREIKKIEDVKRKYNFDITPEQLAWVRRKMSPSAQSEGEAPVEYEADSLRVQEQPFCVTGDTRIGTEFGILPIREARVATENTKGNIVACGPTGKSVIWQARTKLGYTIRGTANHPLIDHLGNQVRLDLSKGHKIQLCPPMTRQSRLPFYTVSWQDGIVSSSVTITHELARFVGLFMGDGSASWGHGKKGSLCEVKITCDKKDEDVIQECAGLFRSLFGVEPTIKRHEKQGRGWVDVQTGVRSVFDSIKKLGLTRNDTAKTMRRVHVPEFIWRSEKSVLREFLRGLFEADGFNAYDTNRVSLFSKYPKFISDVQLLLLAFGITSRMSIQDKTAGDGHKYMGRALDLRTAEAIKFNEDIGFISERKKSRSVKAPYTRWQNRKRPSITLEDTVVSVENTGIVDDVWNVTVEGCHLFDANGILTHNTEEEAFQVTGSAFFQSELLNEQVRDNVSKSYKPYEFSRGPIEFTDLRVLPATNPRSVQLKVWEEPVVNGTYVVACDPAYGASEGNDRSCIQVLRAYADGLDQCAEFTDALVGTRPFAWEILALCGWYADQGSEIYLIVELNGPGAAVWDEIVYMRSHIANGYQTKQIEEMGLKNIFRNVRNYIYTRPDSLAAGKAIQWKTTAGEGMSGKVRLMERFRDFTHSGLLRIRSLDAIEEMRWVSRDGDSIAARGRKKDDRVLGLALGVRCWEERCRRFLSSQKRTRASEAARLQKTVVDQSALFTQHQLESMFSYKRSVRNKEARAMGRASWRFR